MNPDTEIRRSERLMAKGLVRSANVLRRRTKSLAPNKKAQLPLPTLDTADLERLSQELYERQIMFPPPKKRGRKPASSSNVPPSNFRKKKGIAAKFIPKTPSVVGMNSSQTLPNSPPAAPQRNRRITDLNLNTNISDLNAEEDQTPRRKSSCKAKLSEGPKSLRVSERMVEIGCQTEDDYNSLSEGPKPLRVSERMVEVGCQTEDDYNSVIANLQDQVIQLEVLNRHQAAELENLQKIVSNTKCF
uniref:Uncharacterized protein n=1 Tax=Panagrolaimus sp. JU765 TaxID=591449 RepID=A0AC34QX70_9BILA